MSSYTGSSGLMSLGIPANFGMVTGVVALSFATTQVFMGLRVVAARKRTGIKAPDVYATQENCSDTDKRKEFNCIQRAQQNSLEYQPIFLTMLVASGLKFPKTAAACGLAYVAASIGYFMGYTPATMSGRLRKGSFYVRTGVLFALFGMCARVGVKALPRNLTSRDGGSDLPDIGRR